MGQLSNAFTYMTNKLSNELENFKVTNSWEGPEQVAVTTPSIRLSYNGDQDEWTSTAVNSKRYSREIPLTLTATVSGYTQVQLDNLSEEIFDILGYEENLNININSVTLNTESQGDKISTIIVSFNLILYYNFL